MSRHGYSDDCEDNLALGRWRGQVASAIRGKRGQEFLKELLAALNAMPNKRLICGELQKDGEVCAIGAVCVARGIDTSNIDVHDYETISNKINLAHQLVMEIEYQNDEMSMTCAETPEERWVRIRKWTVSKLKEQNGTGNT